MLIFRYFVFAVIATASNLATQRLVLQHATTTSFFALALGSGTVIGLVIKYLLDKRWIFNDIESDTKNTSRKFALYAATGVITTVIFWSAEASFWMIWQTTAMREIGAMIGLTIGYIVKYDLDRRFVFTSSPLVQQQ